jgi:arginyl-tRNA synthetase
MEKFVNLKEKINLEKIISAWKDISNSNNIVWKDSFIKWEIPVDLDADFAVTLAFPISHIKKKNPYETALELIKNFKFSEDLKMEVSDQGYINCSFKSSFYRNCLNEILNENFFTSEKKKINVNIEFVSVNPTGYLHLGHLRNAVIGDTIANLYNFLGFNVVREYYINDRGNQIEELVKSVLFYYSKYQNLEFKLIDEDKLTYNGKAIKDASLYFSQNKTFSLEEIKLNSPVLRDEIINFFINKIKLDLNSCGIKFDNWFSEKKMYENKELLNNLLDEFRTKEIVYEKDNALFLKTKSAGDDKDRVIIKDNGDYTYFLSDIIYHINKLKRSEFLINVWGSDHHGYIGRLLGSLELLGYDAKKRISIILIQMVSLLTDDGSKKFSKRLGTAIDVDDTLKIIEKDQLRFSFLEKESNHTLTINLELLNEQKEKSRLYYIQYAHARCNQILTKWEKMSKVNDQFLINDSFLLNEKKEREILNNLIIFPMVVLNAANEKKPFNIIHYLQSLSKDFQSYYQSYQILQIDNYELSKERVILVKAVKEVLKKGLDLMGISAPDFMENNNDKIIV